MLAALAAAVAGAVALAPGAAAVAAPAPVPAQAGHVTNLSARVMSEPWAITAGPDGALPDGAMWYVANQTLGRMTTNVTP